MPPRALDYLGPVIFEAAASAELFRQLLPPEISGTPPESAPDGFGALPCRSQAQEWAVGSSP